eukprot:gb/GECG01010639.1/.p1 GENE.gb/GECG01010639.1/~~gb/GECG01010639.1/.p1  ORF type:complete len:348 (+),score=27.26 gb/GECG01010639.1/:1-1044(+)
MGVDDHYWDRVKRIFRMMDIRNAFVAHGQIEQAKEIVRKYEQAMASAATFGTTATTPASSENSVTRHGAHGKSNSNDDSAQNSREQYDRARKIIESCVHPDTQQPVSPAFLRIACIIPANMTLDAGMILARTPIQIVAAQFANQSYNALHYYANRNASNTDGTWKLVASYVAATASASCSAVGLSELSKKLPANSAGSVALRRLSPFAAVAVADLLNLSIMRQNEYLEGINIYDEQSNFLGTSKRAGGLAVASCVGARVMAAAPVLLTSSFAVHFLEKTKHISRYPALKIPLTLMMLGVAIQFSVPLTFGLFRQSAQVPTSMLEKEFHNLKDSSGNTISHAYYNKGL